MNLLFVHDHRFRKVGDELYSTGGLNDEVLGRYTVFCDYVTVVARIQEEESANGQWSMITNKKVKILGTGSLSYDGLKDEVMKCDKMIVRLPSVLGLKALEINKKIGKPYLIELVGCPWDSLWNHGIVEKMVAPYFYMSPMSFYSADIPLRENRLAAPMLFYRRQTNPCCKNALRKSTLTTVRKSLLARQRR